MTSIYTEAQVLRAADAVNVRTSEVVTTLARIALSDDGPEARRLRVEALADGLTGDKPGPLTAGASPNIVDDNSIGHGGVSGWNR